MMLTSGFRDIHIFLLTYLALHQTWIPNECRLMNQAWKYPSVEGKVHGAIPPLVDVSSWWVHMTSHLIVILGMITSPFRVGFMVARVALGMFSASTSLLFHHCCMFIQISIIDSVARKLTASHSNAHIASLLFCSCLDISISTLKIRLIDVGYSERISCVTIGVSYRYFSSWTFLPDLANMNHHDIPRRCGKFAYVCNCNLFQLHVFLAVKYEYRCFRILL